MSQSHRTATFTVTFGDYIWFGRWQSLRGRGFEVTPKQRSQYFCTTWNANRPTVLRLYSKYTATADSTII